MALLSPDEKNKLLDQPLINTKIRPKATTASASLSSTKITTEQTIMTDLEITPFDLTTLMIFFQAEHWIPNTTDSDDIDKAASNFHRNFRAADFPFGQTSRLQRLFEAWNDLAQEKKVKRDLEKTGGKMWFEEFEGLRREREGQKVDAMRALVGVVAVSRREFEASAAAGASS